MIRTGYSFHNAVGHLPEVMSRIKEIGWSVAPITDICSTFGFNRWTKLCAKEGVKPIYGVQLTVIPEREGEGKKPRNPLYDRWTFLAIDSLRPLYDAIRLATNRSNEEPSLTYEKAFALPGLIKICGPLTKFNLIKKNYNLENFYVGLSPALSKAQFNFVNQTIIPFIAVSDNYYPRATDLELYRVVLGKRANNQTYPRHILSDEEWRKSCHAPEDVLDQAIENRNIVFNSCNAVMKKGSLLVPEKPKTLLQMCIEGAKRTRTNLDDPVYRERLDRELKLIEEKNFEDYFYVIADMVSYAKQHMIVGPARGSSCGSLVCYLLDITSVDPIPFGLIFERFIDVNRADLPDIDIDFSESKRKMVFEYADEKYQKEHVARLGTVGMFMPQSAMNQISSSLQIPKWETEKVMTVAFEREPGDVRAFQALEDTIRDTDIGKAFIAQFPEAGIVTRIEGHPHNASQHAAGVIITQEPLAELIAVDARTNAAMVDKKDAEDLRLLKIDALGLTQLSVFERAFELIGKQPLGVLEKILLNDKQAFKVLNDGKFSGVFQFNGQALQGLTRQIDVQHIEDLVAITALARPGPMATGGSTSWVKRKNGHENIPIIHPILDELTKSTYGVIVYQEQVMNIVRQIGNFSWEDTSAVRRIISNSMGGEAFERFREKFIEGAKQNGINQTLAEYIWTHINTMGGYAFNRCLDGNTRIKLASTNGYSNKIKDLYRMYVSHPTTSLLKKWKGNPNPILVSLNKDNRGYPQIATKIIKSGKKICYSYRFGDGSKVTCTKDHKFIINGGWKSIGEAKLGDIFSSLVYEEQISSINDRGKGHAKGKKYGETQKGFPIGKDNPAFVSGVTMHKNEFKQKMKGKPCEDCGVVKSRMEAHHNDFNEGKDRPNDITWLCVSCHKERHYNHGRKRQWEKGYVLDNKILVSRKPAGVRQTYDIEMPNDHNFILENGLITHNSHSVAYGLISYWCCWFKAHHPFEFAAATLDYEHDPDRQIIMLRELEQEGVSYVPVDLQRSHGEQWTPFTDPATGVKTLIGPLTAIHGIGPASIIEINDANRFNNPIRESLAKRLEKSETKIDTLYPVADRIKKLDLKKLKVVTQPTPIKKVQCGIEGQVMIIGVVKKIDPRDENEPAKVEKRKGRIFTGPTAALNLFFYDDTGEIFCKIDRYKFDEMAKPVIANGRVGKAIYAVKGTVPASFRMISIDAIRHLGDMEQET